MYTKGKWRVDNAYGVSTNDGGLIVEAVQDGFTKVVAMINAHKEAEANARLIASAPVLYEELVEADKVICELCKRLNPQHATADYGKGCDWCQDREDRLKALAKAK